MISEWVKGQIKCSYKYYYRLLTSQERTVYKQLLIAVSEFEPSCEISECVDTHAFSKIYNYLLLDNPAMFYVESVVLCCVEKRFVGRISYKYSRKMADLIARQLDLRLERIALICGTESLLDTEKRVHDYLVQNVHYDDQFADDMHSSHTALLKGRAVCDGFSKAAKLIFDRVSIQSIVIMGKSDVQQQNASNDADGHAWNIVNINGRLYHLDVTFDANLSSSNHIRYDYFNLNDEQIQKDHILNTCYQIKSTSDANDYYTQQGLYFQSKRCLKNALQEALQKQETQFAFRLPFTKDPEKTINEISNLIRTTIQFAPRKHFHEYSMSMNLQQMIIHLQFDV